MHKPQHDPVCSAIAVLTLWKNTKSSKTFCPIKAIMIALREYTKTAPFLKKSINIFPFKQW